MVWALPAQGGQAVGLEAIAQPLGQNSLHRNGINNQRKAEIMNKRQNSTCWLGLALACGTLTFAVTTQAAKPPKPPPTPTGPAYRIVSLGNLGWNPLRAVAINQVGWIGGYGWKTTGEGAACLLVPGPSPDGPIYFRDTSPADGVNDLIQVLPPLPAAINGRACDVNNAGWVVGSCDLASLAATRATIWVDNTPVD